MKFQFLVKDKHNPFFFFFFSVLEEDDMKFTFCHLSDPELSKEISLRYKNIT